MRALIYFVNLSAVFAVTSALYCLSCDEIQDARSCDSVEKYSSGQVCYSTQLMTSSGRMYRKMGCRDASTCLSGVILGKRQHDRRKSSEYSDSVRHKSFTSVTDGKEGKSRRSSNDTICDECCNSDLCQTSLCSEKDTARFGPVCFNCDAYLRSESCSKIDRCNADETCFNAWSRQSNLTILQRSGCTYKTTCGHYHIPQGSQDACWMCCDGDLCNNNCTTEYVQGVGKTTPGYCIDRTPASTCEQARAIVCKDKYRARNAGCAHYCGFC